MLALSTQDILLIILVPIVGYLVAKLAFKKDTEVENRRRAAANLARVLSEQGLVRIPDFLIDYSVGDYSGMVSNMHSLAELFLNGEAAVIEEFKHVYERVLEKKLKNPEARAYLAARLAENTTDADVQAKPIIAALVKTPSEVKLTGTV